MINYNGSYIYREFELLGNNDLQDLGMNDLVQYAFEVNKAIGVKNGFLHNEFYLDDKGPILIEANCRLMGGPWPSDYLADATTYPQSKIWFNSYLFPETYDSKIKLQYNINDFNKVLIVYLISPITGKIKSWPYRPLIKRFKSFNSKYNDLSKPAKKLVKSVDFETSVGAIYFQGEENSVKEEEKFLRLLNLNYFYLLFEVDNEPKLTHWKPKGISAINYINSIYKNGPVLFVNDYGKQIDYVKTSSLNNLSKQLDNYLYVVLNLKN